jgi:hypothetical protein
MTVRQIRTMKINLGDVGETLLVPLWEQAKFSRENLAILNGTKAIELVAQLDYDFSTLDKTLGVLGNLMYAARAKHIDDKIARISLNIPKHRSLILGRASTPRFTESTTDRLTGATLTFLRSSTFDGDSLRKLSGRRASQNLCSIPVDLTTLLVLKTAYS